MKHPASDAHFMERNLAEVGAQAAPRVPRALSLSRVLRFSGGLALITATLLTGLPGSHLASAADPNKPAPQNETEAKEQKTKEAPQKKSKGKAAPTKAPSPELKSGDAPLGQLQAGKLTNEEQKAAQAAYRKAREALRSAQANRAPANGNAGSDEKLTEQEARKALKNARKELKELRRSGAVRFAQLSDEDRKKFRKALQERDAERSTTRKERAEAHRKRLKEELGKDASQETIQDELRIHAWRVARLMRLIELAKLSKQPEAEQRAQQLHDKELKRHQARLKTLKGAAQ